jgi:hypothetical protein
MAKAIAIKVEKIQMMWDINTRILLPTETTTITPLLRMNVLESARQQASEYKWRNIVRWITYT